MEGLPSPLPSEKKREDEARGENDVYSLLPPSLSSSSSFSSRFFLLCRIRDEAKREKGKRTNGVPGRHSRGKLRALSSLSLSKCPFFLSIPSSFLPRQFARGQRGSFPSSSGGRWTVGGGRMTPQAKMGTEGGGGRWRDSGLKKCPFA